ncbi:MAG: glycerol-3-phosphate responsive antiterminator [Paenibacillus sp.]|uniref:glycerol-3-phosphate responsive antiterminator n=1 Tax=Paenibacillus aquistagni TaxID=1852522 RepID=UPI000B50CDDA|nr:glycerol-3-phosphate responsive antiterminator [Paenibacillus aquistagni]MBR2567663.1 glycerol-3-phosphate responsive antiterminator [Paenibacillus sp.]NMM52305.1 glycerol-3-phosphate responsive antiterminator [Paenibacillus aquistagni]
MKLHHLFSPFTVIAAVKTELDMARAERMGVRNIFLVRSSLSELKAYSKQVEKNGMRLFVYFDMIRGLSQDKEAVQFLLNEVQVCGLVSNKAHVVKEAKRLGVYGILTMFLLDSYSLELSGKVINDLQPDAINIAPGNLPKNVRELSEQYDVPIIASGLITLPEEVGKLYEAGACAVSTSQSELWSIEWKMLEQEHHAP